MFQAIFFDLDQTLVDRSATFAAYLQQVYEALSLQQYDISQAKFFEAVLRWDDNGYRAKPDTFGRALQHLGQPQLLDELLSHFAESYGQQAVLLPGVVETLAGLKRRFPLALITNGREQGQTVKLEVTGIADYFTEILISESEGLKKPEPEIYLRACRRMGVTPEQVLFVGDHPGNDVSAPMALGMQAVWVQNEAYAAPAECWATVQSVAELPALL